MAVLEFLARHRGQAYTVDDLLNKVWHSESDSTEDAVRQCIARLRKKIDKGPDSIIKTMRNAGYMVE
jgi:DNA-binding response OmpR family regulator